MARVQSAEDRLTLIPGKFDDKNCHEVRINISRAVKIFNCVRFDKFGEMTPMNERRVRRFPGARDLTALQK